jgi:hypothetical protein
MAIRDRTGYPAECEEGFLSSFDGHWHKSSFSNAGGCVEVLHTPGTIYVRDTKDRSGPVLQFNEREWSAFTRGVINHEFDVEDFDDDR